MMGFFNSEVWLYLLFLQYCLVAIVMCVYII